VIATKEDLRNIYRLILTREPNSTEFDYWLSKIQQEKMTLITLAAYAFGSHEFQALSSSTVDEGEICEALGLVTEAEKLVSRINSPAEAIGLLGSEQSAWWHSFTLSDGTVINGVKSPEHLRAEFEIVFESVPVKGRTVLDVGAWNGAFSVEAMRRGARRVLSVDFFTWLHPNWRGLEKFLYIRKDSGYDIDFKVMDVRNISKESVGQFDVVLFLGVFYHLREPISILDRLADIVTDTLVLETYLDPLDGVPYPAMRYYPGAELVGDSSNWWGPNHACMEALLRTSGFSDIRWAAHPLAANRGIFHAKRGESSSPSPSGRPTR
jgi:tRNA (mo5U34)-methyltransferase